MGNDESRINTGKVSNRLLLSHSGRAWKKAFLYCLLFTSPWCHAAAITEYSALAFGRYELLDERLLDKVRATGNLGAWHAGRRAVVQGAFEYDVKVDQDGWYALRVETDRRYTGNRYGYQHTYIIDGDVYLNGAGYKGWQKDQGFHVGNVWLERGSHTLRIESFKWQGFHPIARFSLSPVGERLLDRLRIQVHGPHFGPRFIRQGEPLRLDVFSAGLSEGEVFVQVRRRSDDKPVTGRLPVVISATNRPRHEDFLISGIPEGSYYVRFYHRSLPVKERDIRRIEFEVVNTRPAPVTGGNERKELVHRIDCVRTPPTRGGITRVVDGAYRESESRGFRQNRGKGSWFGYQLPRLKGQKPYLLEVDYPVDTPRKFAVSIRSRNPLYYSLTSGAEQRHTVPGGGSGTIVMPFWPRADDLPVVALMNARNGMRAACRTIRVYQLDEHWPVALRNVIGGRHFGHWFEEPDRWAAVYGAATVNGRPTLEGYRISAERWARTVAYLGGDTLSVTGTVYAQALYPSHRFNRDVNTPYTTDLLQLILLVAEKYGLRVIVDLHPRALELAEGDTDQLAQRLLYARNGFTHDTVPVGVGRGARTQQPRFNPIQPDVQAWYLGLVDELAERYASYRSFAGIALRVTGFENASLNNFHSLDWGYGDYTMKCLREETGIDVVGLSPAERYAQLTGSHLDTWLAWRSQHISELFEKLVKRLRTRRSDLQLYLYLMGGRFMNIQEAGVDYEKLGAIPGLSLVKGDFRYGYVSASQTASVARLEEQRMRDKLTSVETLGSNHTSAYGGYLFSAAYLELNGQELPPQMFGLPPDTPPVHTSAHLVPAGRQALERYALALAESDAAVLLNGGNAYFVDPPIVSEFMNTYRRLPDVKFNPREDARDPVAVREHSGEEAYYFYAVNREPYPMNIEVFFNRTGFVEPITGNGGQNTDRLTITLKAFELVAFKGPSSLAIDAINVRIPKRRLALLEKRLSWLEDLAAQPAKDAEILRRYASDIRRALKAGWIWRARTLMESADLLAVFDQRGRFPP